MAQAMQALTEEVQRLRAESEARAPVDQLVAAVLAGGAQPRREDWFIDIRGIARPREFNNDGGAFVNWARKLESYIGSVHEWAPGMMSWIVEQRETITLEQVLLQEEFTTLNPQALRSLDRQLHALLVSLTDGESFDLVQAAGNANGLEEEALEALGLCDAGQSAESAEADPEPRAREARASPWRDRVLGGPDAQVLPGPRLRGEPADHP